MNGIIIDQRSPFSGSVSSLCVPISVCSRQSLCVVGGSRQQPTVLAAAFQGYCSPCLREFGVVFLEACGSQVASLICGLASSACFRGSWHYSDSPLHLRFCQGWPGVIRGVLLINPSWQVPIFQAPVAPTSAGGLYTIPKSKCPSFGGMLNP